MPDSKRKQKPDVSIIGAGRLGTTLAVALAHQGYPIRSVVARRRNSAHKAARLAASAAIILLDGDIQVLAVKQLPLLRADGLFLIATPDDQIAPVATQLAQLDTGKRKPIVLHTSGALSSAALAPLRARGWHTGSIHPLISVSEKPQGIPELRGAYWSIEGDSAALRLAKTVVRDLGGRSFTIRSDDKPLYHAAAVMTAGNVVALFDVALEMLVQCGLDRKTARSILLPLLASTVRNLEARDPAAALTGPFSRGDVETVKRHLKALERSKLKESSELYRLLGKRSLKMIGKYPEITRLLKSV